MYQVTVCGIPAQAEVTDWNEYLYKKGGYPTDVELYDRKGYRAEWLERKMRNTEGELNKVLDQIENYDFDPY